MNHLNKKIRILIASDIQLTAHQLKKKFFFFRNHNVSNCLK